MSTSRVLFPKSSNDSKRLTCTSIRGNRNWLKGAPMSELNLRSFECRPVGAINETIIAHTPKIIWLTPAQMMLFRTNFTFAEWRDMQISELGKFGVLYCKTE